MRQFFTINALASLVLLGAGCNPTSEKPPSNLEPTPMATSTEKTSVSNTSSTKVTYSVDEFVTTAFRQEGRIHIRVDSVTCYNNSCGFDGKKSSISLNQEESKPFLALSNRETSFIIEAETACPTESIQCHAIKNVRVVND